MNNWYAAEVLARLQEARVRKQVEDAWIIRGAKNEDSKRGSSILVRGIRLIRGKSQGEGRAPSP